MKFKIFKDKSLRFDIKNIEKKKKIFLFLLKKKNLCYKLKCSLFIILTKIPKYLNKIHIKNRCILTGNSRSISRKYHISRIPLKYLLFFKKFEGIQKATW